MAAKKDPKPSSPQNKQVTSRTSINTGFSGGVGAAPKGARGFSTNINPANKGGKPKVTPNYNSPGTGTPSKKVGSGKAVSASTTRSSRKTASAAAFEASKPFYKQSNLLPSGKINIKAMDAAKAAAYKKSASGKKK